jgi:hypothetical protein
MAMTANKPILLAMGTKIPNMAPIIRTITHIGMMALDAPI